MGYYSIDDIKNRNLYDGTRFRQLRNYIKCLSIRTPVNLHKFNLYNMKVYTTTGRTFNSGRVLYKTDKGKSIFRSGHTYDIYEAPSNSTSKRSHFGVFLCVSFCRETALWTLYELNVFKQNSEETAIITPYTRCQYEHTRYRRYRMIEMFPGYDCGIETVNNSGKFDYFGVRQRVYSKKLAPPKKKIEDSANNGNGAFITNYADTCHKKKRKK